MLSGSTLYGMSPSGGSYERGTVFRLNTDGSGYSLIHEFFGGESDGQYPRGALTLAGGTLYGMAFGGGSGSYGTIFRMDTNGGGYSLLHHFTGGSMDGASPRGTLTLNGSTLFGMTSGGGSGGFGDGTIFRINTDGTGFRLLHSFSASQGYGAEPMGSLTLVGTRLYGMTRLGLGPGTRTPTGTVFGIDLDGTNFDVLHTFGGGNNDGAEPWGSLTYDGSRLYGTTTAGGPADKGTIFATNTDGSGFTVLHAFTNTTSDGGNPFGSLALAGTKLYGTTQQNGANAEGTVFSINTDGTDFTLLHSFTGFPNDGSGPRSDLTFSPDGATFFGTAPSGGADDRGVVFLFAVPEPASVMLLAVGGILANFLSRHRRLF